MRTPLNGLGPPYRLPSDAIYFTDWRYVHPGAVGWRTAQGERGRLWSKEDVPDGFQWHPTDMPHGIRIRAQKAQKSPFFITHDKPWERFIIWCTLIHEHGRYRLWYGTCPPSGFDAPSPNLADLLCYAESDDGFAWRKPCLGIADFEGKKDTNICFGGTLARENGHHGATVFVDPSAPTSERYKLIYAGHPTAEELETYRRERPDDIDPLGVGRRPEHLLGVYGATSPDGLHWTRLPGPLVLQNSDTQTTAEYDDRLKKYVAYFRTWYLGRRCVGRAESDDFRRFPLPENILWPGPELTPSEQWYTNAKTTYPGASDYHLMFPALYRVSDDSMEVHMFSSADGINWSAVPGGPGSGAGRPEREGRGLCGHGLRPHGAAGRAARRAVPGVLHSAQVSAGHSHRRNRPCHVAKGQVGRARSAGGRRVSPVPASGRRHTHASERADPTRRPRARGSGRREGQSAVRSELCRRRPGHR